MPQQPAKNGVSTPSRSTYCASRKRTIAWATVSRVVIVPPCRGCRGGRACRTAVAGRRLVGPGVADPAVRRVVADPPGPLVARAGHHVEVVEVVAGHGHRRAVPSVRDEHDVAAADLGQDVDLLAGVPVDALVGDTGSGRSGGDLEVVDLLELALVVARLVVLVRRVRRPVAARREDLARDDRVRVERVGRAEVVDLAARLPGAAQLDRHGVRRLVPERQATLAARRREGEPAASELATMISASRGT